MRELFASGNHFRQWVAKRRQVHTCGTNGYHRPPYG